MNYAAAEFEKRRRRRKTCHGIAITLLVILLVLAASVFIHLAAEARRVLREAKNAQLAVKAVTIEYYALDKQVFDMTQPSGFTPEALADIRYYSAIEGDLFLVSAEEDGFDPASLIYVSKNGYIATYGVQEPGWVVSRPLRLSAETGES